MKYSSPSNYETYASIFYENNFTCKSGDAYDGSVTNVGHPTDISISTIALFESINLTGNMTQHTSNVESYAGNFSSFVVTPPGLATFYTRPNYGGLSICLKPSPGYAGGTHWTWRINELGLVAGQIKSMKLGCDSTNIHYSSHIPTQMKKDG